MKMTMQRGNKGLPYSKMCNRKQRLQEMEQQTLCVS